MSRMMKVARLYGAGDVRLDHEPVPGTGSGEVLIRMGTVGLCGSDIHWFDDAGIGDARLEQPLILGHEMAGMAETGTYAGRLVAIDPAINCGVCEFCRGGNPNFCSTLRFAGHAREDGGLREYMAWPEKCLFPLPEELTASDGAMLEPLGVVIYAIDLSNIRPGMTVGIFGCGPIGILLIQLSLLSGATQVFATEKLPHRLSEAERFGAVPLIADGNEAQIILKGTKMRGLDVVIEAAGDNAAVEAAIAAVKPGGKVTLVGIPADDRTSVCASEVRRKGLAIQWVRRMKHTYPRAIELVRSGRIDVRSIVTDRYRLDDIKKAFQTAAGRQGLKTVVAID